MLLGAGMIREGQRSTEGSRPDVWTADECTNGVVRPSLRWPGPCCRQIPARRWPPRGRRGNGSFALVRTAGECGRTAPSWQQKSTWGERVRGFLREATTSSRNSSPLGLEWGAASIRAHTARVLLRRGDLAEAHSTGRPGAAEASHSSVPAAASPRRPGRDRGGPGRRRSAALDQVRAGLEELHAWQSSFGSLDLQTMVVGHGTSTRKPRAALAVESGSARVLYEWSERARMLASRIQPVRVPADDANDSRPCSAAQADIDRGRGAGTPSPGGTQRGDPDPRPGASLAAARIRRSSRTRVAELRPAGSASRHRPGRLGGHPGRRHGAGGDRRRGHRARPRPTRRPRRAARRAAAGPRRGGVRPPRDPGPQRPGPARGPA